MEKTGKVIPVKSGKIISVLTARMIDHIRTSLEKTGTTVHAADIIAAAEVRFDECPVEGADREMFLDQMRGALGEKELRVG